MSKTYNHERKAVPIMLSQFFWCEKHEKQTALYNQSKIYLLGPGQQIISASHIWTP